MGASWLGMAIPRATCRPHQRGNFTRNLAKVSPSRGGNSDQILREFCHAKLPTTSPTKSAKKRRNDLKDPVRGLKDHIENVARVFLSFDRIKTPAAPPRILAGAPQNPSGDLEAPVKFVRESCPFYMAKLQQNPARNLVPTYHGTRIPRAPLRILQEVWGRP